MAIVVTWTIATDCEPCPLCATTKMDTLDQTKKNMKLHRNIECQKNIKGCIPVLGQCNHQHWLAQCLSARVRTSVSLIDHALYKHHVWLLPILGSVAVKQHIMQKRSLRTWYVDLLFELSVRVTSSNVNFNKKEFFHFPLGKCYSTPCMSTKNMNWLEGLGNPIQKQKSLKQANSLATCTA